MASVASQLIEEVTAHAQTDSLEDAREICADGTYFPNNLRICMFLLPPTDTQLIPQQYLFTQSTLQHVLTFPCHHQGVLHLRLAMLHKFLNCNC